jgi:hypothetical protein
MNQIMMGALAMGFAVAGLFFLRFWRNTGDRLFALFALSFFVLAVNRVGLALTTGQGGAGDYLYWVRFVAFALILLAILDKNLTRKPPSS